MPGQNHDALLYRRGERNAVGQGPLYRAPMLTDQDG